MALQSPPSSPQLLNTGQNNKQADKQNHRQNGESPKTEGNPRTGSYTNATKDPEAGLLTTVEREINSGDPLASLIQSLAALSPIRAPSALANHKADGGALAQDNSVIAGNAANSSPNQSPKAWQNSTQVCLSLLLLHCIDLFTIFNLILIVSYHSDEMCFLMFLTCCSLFLHQQIDLHLKCLYNL